MSKSFYQEFDKASSKSWKQKIQVDLKGADYNETLIWRTGEGIDVKPFYHPDEFAPEDFQSLKSNATWRVGQTLSVSDALEGNQLAKEAVSKGAEALLFSVDGEDINLDILLKDLQHIPISLIGSSVSKTPDTSITVFSDPISGLASTGNWSQSMEPDLKQYVNSVKASNQIAIQTGFYQNAGASIVQQLAYTLSHLNEYLNLLNKDKDFSFKDLHLSFQVAIGGNYFFEIAKLRALRLLWQTLSKVYGAPSSCTITAIPSQRNKSIYDYNVNMLRTTTECMSAILGGADIVFNQPYDSLYHKSNEFGDRIARNQLLILKHESYFGMVQNPSDGAYYIESLTEQLADKALDLFKNIENNDGFIQQLMAGTIQRKIKESAEDEQRKFDAGTMVLLGVNTFPNEEDKMKNNLQKDPFLKIEKRKTLIKPIIQKRLSEKLEKSRLENE